jgi:hypothetical protein
MISGSVGGREFGRGTGRAVDSTSGMGLEGESAGATREEGAIDPDFCGKY